jgi:hypothetical protein
MWCTDVVSALREAEASLGVSLALAEFDRCEYQVNLVTHVNPSVGFLSQTIAF